MRYYIVLTLITLKIQAASLTLAWNASITPNVTYNIYQSPSDSPYLFVINTIGLTVTLNYNDAITNSFYVKARSTNGLESVASNIVIVNALAPQPPAPPTNLRVTILNKQKRNLNWLVANDVNSVVEKAIESSNYSQVATLPPGVMNWVDSRSRQKLTRYRVQACKSLCSTWSEITYIP